MKTWVIALGGSIIAPDGVDTDFICDIYTLLTGYVDHQHCRFILVIGGGAPARVYQQAYKDISLMLYDEHDIEEDDKNNKLDTIGIMATHLNATLVKEVFAGYTEDTIITNPEDPNITFKKSILIGAGWKPGFSTDLDAVMLAQRFKADTVINLSNINAVYTADPRIDASAKALDSITWNEFIDMVGSEWKPGMNAPFDPVASKLASEINLRVITTDGRDLDNLNAILQNNNFMGTTIKN